VGVLRGADYLRHKVIAPGDEVAVQYRPVVVQTTDGESVSGVILNEDTFAVRIREPSGRVRSFVKSDLATRRVDPNRSLMPSYRTMFTDAELDDLVAFLARQGRP
jgi:putative heme-binding domain-containing protein